MPEQSAGIKGRMPRLSLRRAAPTTPGSSTRRAVGPPRRAVGPAVLAASDLGPLAPFRLPPWRIAIAVAGLLMAVVIAGVAGLLLNDQVKQVTDRALRYDIELEDEGDDVRVAVLDVRHYHRNLMFLGPSESRIDDFEKAYVALIEELGELEELAHRDPSVPNPDSIQETAQSYYADFRPAIDLYHVDPAAFMSASDAGLKSLAEIQGAAEMLDEMGEERADASFHEVETVTGTARLVLLTVIIGLVLLGVMLAYAAIRWYARQQAATEALAVASQAKTDLIADVSHELRTPLTVLRGNAELGLELVRDCDHVPMLEEVVKESASMARMVEDLMFLARSDSAPAPLKPETVEVLPFVTELAARAEMLAKQHGMSLDSSVSGEGQLLGDPTRIAQAVLNLVDNAVNYSPAGERVTLNAATRASELWIEVADRGAGIPEEDLPRIFDRFYRVDKMRTRKQDGTGKQGGTGLGLSIVKAIVEAHGGHIDANSRVGEGTRITVRLPLQPPWRPGGEVEAVAGRRDRLIGT